LRARCNGARRLRVALLTGTALTFVALPAYAQVAQTWNGSTSTDWFVAGNWDSNTVPSSIPPRDSVTIDTVTSNPTVMTGGTADLNGLNVGFTGTGSLTANGGAAITVTNNNLTVGGDTSGTFPAANGTVVLDASSLTVTGTPPSTGMIFVGASGTGSFTAQNGSTVSTVDSYVGHLQGASGTVSVNASAWTNSGSNFVGNQGTGVFNVQNAGTVTVTGDTVLGADTTGNGTINISGTTSAWTTTGLTILGGNAITPVGGTGTINISNAGSYTANGAQNFVGRVGIGAMNITSGGQLSSGGVTYLGYSSGSSGMVVIDGATSAWNVTGSGVVIGGNDGSIAGGDGNVVVRNGGKFNSADVLLGIDSTHTSTGTVTVMGFGSNWNAGSVFVGWDSRGAVNILDQATLAVTTDLSVGTCNCSFGTMNVSGGSAVTIGGNWTIGEDAGGTGIMTITGSGTSVSATGDLSVGLAGIGTLNVVDGASATAASAYIGFSTGSNGTVNVSGTGSSLRATGDLTVGDSGTGTLNVQNGASVTAVNAVIGNNASANGTVNVIGAGSTLTLSGGLLVGRGGIGTGALNITEGGVANVTGNVLNGDRVFVAAGSVINSGGYGATSGVTTSFGLRSSASGQIDAGAGVAALAGALVIAGHNSVQTTYTLVHSSGLGGTFDLVSYAAALRNPVITYTIGGDVLLTVDAFQLASALPSGATGNQRNVAQALDNLVAGGTTLPAGFDDAYNLTGDGLLNALSQLSGEAGTGAQQSGFYATSQFINTVFDTAFENTPAQGGAAPLGYAPQRKVSREAAQAYAVVTPNDRAQAFDQRWNVWAAGYGGSASVNGDNATGSNRTTSRVYGAVAGATYRSMPDMQFGFALGGAGSSFGIDKGFGSGKADMFNAAAYGRYTMAAAYVAAALGYSWQDASTDRTVTTAGTDMLHASFHPQALTARLEAGRGFATPAVGVTPYAGLQSTTFVLPSYGETATSGSNQFALSYSSHNVTATRAELGARFDKVYAVQGAVLTLKARTAWAHDWNTARSATASFQTLPGASFIVNGAQPSANAALVSLGGEMNWGRGWTVAANFDGEFAASGQTYAGKGTIKYAW
jgi:T5SS/PEP-CTERM-associated repeat protein